MVEQKTAKHAAPATTATTARRPGTWRISRSTPSITFTARPVWNSTSPIRMKSGIGVSEKLATEITLLRTIWVRPASPPRKSSAPMRLMTRKENATGSPRKSRTADPPRIRSAAAPQDTASARRNGVAARRALAKVQPAHAEQHLDRKQQEGDRQRREHPPLRRNERFHPQRSRMEACARRGGAGPRATPR